ncbi:MAG TPA: PAS domain S-box protein [Rhodocyclaceae bacterium]|nr:PAS domain S-box protein [Rhodocyclaceae bacterium]
MPFKPASPLDALLRVVAGIGLLGVGLAFAGDKTAAPADIYELLTPLLFVVGSTLLAFYVYWRGRSEGRAGRNKDEQRRSEQRFRELLEATHDGVCEYDLRTSRYSYLSPQAQQMLGAERSLEIKLSKHEARAIIHPDDLPLAQAALKAHLVTGCPYDVELRIIDAQGEWRWMRSRGAVIREGRLKPSRMIGTLADIDSSRNATVKLRRYEALMRTVLDVIPDPILVKDRNYRLLMVNRAYAERAGLTPQALIGKVTHEFMPLGQADQLVQADAAVFETEADQVFELSIPNRASNSFRSYTITKRLAHDTDGAPIMVGIHSDVTELRRAIAEFAAVIEQTPLVAVQGFNRNCVLTHWNRASESLFGFTAAQAIGSRLQDLILSPRMQRVFELTVEDAWAGQQTFGPREIGLRLPNGRKVWLLATLFPVVQEGQVVELFSMAVDVTARHEAERQLALHRDNLQSIVAERTAGLVRAKQDVELALQAKSEFLANMSHELRTPMHAVLSFAKLGEERALSGTPDKMRDYFSRIAVSGERLLHLINNLLDLSKFEAGKMLLQLHSTELVSLVRDVAAELEPLLDKKRLQIELPPGDLILHADIDAARISQVLSNLLANAIKFSPSGGVIKVTLKPAALRSGRRATDTQERAAISLEISDNGPGIPAGELEAVFEKFVQSSSTRTGAGGTGLGLSICREIVHAHHGRISVCNLPEGGALFEVLLPRHAVIEIDSAPAC